MEHAPCYPNLLFCSHILSVCSTGPQSLRHTQRRWIVLWRLFSYAGDHSLSQGHQNHREPPFICQIAGQQAVKFYRMLTHQLLDWLVDLKKVTYSQISILSAIFIERGKHHNQKKMETFWQMSSIFKLPTIFSFEIYCYWHSNVDSVCNGSETSEGEELSSNLPDCVNIFSALINSNLLNFNIHKQ